MKKIIFVIIALLFILMTFNGCKQKEVSLNKVSLNSNGSIHIEGRGRAFENTIGIAVKDDYRFLLYQGSVITNAKDVGLFGDFKADILLNYFPQSDSITIEAFISSPKDGSIIATDSKKLNYNMPCKVVKVFYGNSKLNPEMLDCTKVFPVDRRIASNSQNPPLDTLKIFLLGPTEDEVSNGYVMSTPKGLTINWIKNVSSNKIQVDFGKELLNVSGGSCRVSAIRSEITQTILQFYPGYEVIISANGDAETVLQP